LIIDDKLPELHKTTLSEFRNKEVLLKSIDTQFVKIINQEMSNIDIMDRLLLLINSIYKCTENHFEGSKIFLFGSRMSGLALKDSDVDLYFCIGNINIIYYLILTFLKWCHWTTPSLKQTLPNDKILKKLIVLYLYTDCKHIILNKLKVYAYLKYNND